MVTEIEEARGTYTKTAQYFLRSFFFCLFVVFFCCFLLFFCFKLGFCLILLWTATSSGRQLQSPYSEFNAEQSVI